MIEKFEDMIFIKEKKLEDKSFFVLQNTKGEYYVLESSSYQSYHLTPGFILQARLRKKGCAGNKIVELFHPYYKNGEIYPFTIVRIGELSQNENPIWFAEICDRFGDKYKVRIKEPLNYKEGMIINCILTGQEQGRLFFSTYDC